MFLSVFQVVRCSKWISGKIHDHISNLLRFGTFRLVSVSCDTDNKSFKRVIILFKQDKITCSNEIISRLNELLSCLNKINNLLERHNKSFKLVIILFKQDK